MASVSQRGGVWCVRYWYEDEMGRKRQKRVGGFARREDAMQAAKSLEAKSNAGIDVNGDKNTCGQIMERWFSDHCGALAASTRAKYSDAIDRLAKTDVYALPVRRVRPGTLSALISALEAGGGGARPIARRTAVSLTEPLRLSLSWAFRHQLIPVNPLQGAQLPKTPKRQQAILTDDDIRDLAAASASQAFHVPLLLALYGGLRREEVAALRWRDVDFSRRTVTVRQAITRTAKGKEILKDTKTIGSSRTVSMPRFVMDALAALPRAGERVCVSRSGEPYRLDSYPQAVRRLIDRINDQRAAENARRLQEAKEKGRPVDPAVLRSPVPQATFHDLRHTHAAMLIRMGIQPKVIQERLGHASIKITMDLYGYLMPGLQATVADALDTEFQSASSGHKSGHKDPEKPEKTG